jgi:hypothetical protein
MLQTEYTSAVTTLRLFGSVSEMNVEFTYLLSNNTSVLVLSIQILLWSVGRQVGDAMESMNKQKRGRYSYKYEQGSAEEFWIKYMESRIGKGRIWLL